MFEEYPKNKQLTALGLVYKGFDDEDTRAMHPNTFKGRELNSGEFKKDLDNTPIGVLNLMTLEGILLIRYAAVRRASPSKVWNIH